MSEEIFKGLAHVAIHTDKYEEVIRFYTEILPFELVSDLYVDGGEDPNNFFPLKIAQLKLNDLYIEVMETADKRQFDNITGYYHHIGITVSDVDKAIEYVLSRGLPPERISKPGRGARNPYPINTMRNCSMIGPCGERINFYEKDNKIYEGGRFMNGVYAEYLAKRKEEQEA